MEVDDKDEDTQNMIPLEWMEILNGMLSNKTYLPKIMTFGGKGVGKSTLNKWFLNNILSTYRTAPIIYTDLDPGQPELTPPGILSVHIVDKPLKGPNHKHLTQPLRAIFFGTTNISEDPSSYVNAIKELASFVQTLPSYAHIINTSGFCEGLGTTLAVEIIKQFCPNVVIQLNINNPRRCFPFELNLKQVLEYRSPSILDKFYPGVFSKPLELTQSRLAYNFISLDSVCHPDGGNVNKGVNSKDLRDTLFTSYFSNATQAPVALNFDNVKFGCMKSSFSPHDMIDSINGNLIALCRISDATTTGEVFDEAFPIRTLDYDANNAVLSKSRNNFFGYGIVRALDISAKKLWMLTPISAELLSQTNVVLAAGTLGLPNSIKGISHICKEYSQRNLLDTNSKRNFVPMRVARNRLPSSAM